IAAAARGLARIPDLVEMAGQRFNIAAGRLTAGLQRNAAAHERDLVGVSARLSPLLLQRPQAVQKQRLDSVALRLAPAYERRLVRLGEQLASLEKLRVTLNPVRPLDRGFARIHRADGELVRSAGALTSGEGVTLHFRDGERGATIDGTPTAAPAAPKPARPAAKPKPAPSTQGDLF